MKSKFGAASKKKGGKKNDLSLLEDALVGNAEKKVRDDQKELIADIISYVSTIIHSNVCLNYNLIRLKRRRSWRR